MILKWNLHIPRPGMWPCNKSMFSHVTVFIQLVVYTIWIHTMFIQLGCKKTIYAVIITESGIQSGRRILNENSMDSFCIVDMLISSRDGSNVCFSSAVFAGSRRFLLSRHLFNTASKVETSVDRILHHIQDFKRHLMKSYGKVYRPICR